MCNLNCKLWLAKFCIAWPTYTIHNLYNKLNPVSFLIVWTGKVDWTLLQIIVKFKVKESSRKFLLKKYYFSLVLRKIWLKITAKRKLERLQFSTSSSFVKIWSACSCEFKAYSWTFWALYHLLFDLETIGVNKIIIWWLVLEKKPK